MSEPPPLTPSNDELTPEPLLTQRSHRRLWKILLGIGLGLGSIITVGGVVFYVWGDRIVTSLLLPRVAETLDESIQRPVELGDVEGFAFWGVKLGKTVIPPTETDASSVTVDGIEITIGLRSLLFQRTLKSNVVLLRPEISLIENEDGQWLELDLPEPSEAERPIELEIESIKVVNASLSALPYTAGSEAVVPRAPIQIEDTDALVEFFGKSAQEASFELEGEVVAEDPQALGENAKELGSFAIAGAANLETQTVKANARIINLPSIGANLLLPDALGIRSGELDGNLTVEADFDEGKLDQDTLDVRGTAQFLNGELVVEALESPVQNVRSQLVFSGQQVSIEETSLQLNDTILLAAGSIGVEEGYDLTAQIPSVTVAEVQTLANADLPVAVDGAFTLTTEVTGEIDRPNIKGRLASLEPLLVDKVSLNTIVADFSTTLPDFELSGFNLDELRVEPATGGQIVANGRADLSALAAGLEKVTFELAGNADVPTDAIAQTYGANLPPEIVLGTLNADFEAAGNLETQTASADWQLSEGLVTASGRANVTELQPLAFQISGQANAPIDVVARAYDVDLPPDIVLGQLSADFEAVGDSAAQAASANWRIAEGLVAASGQARVTDLQQLAFDLSGQASLPADVVAQAYDANLPPDIALGILDADFRSSGDLETQTAFADWRLSQGSFFGRGDVSLVDNIVALDNAQIQADEGIATAAATLNLETQNWRAAANTDRFAVGQLTNLASGLLSADLVAAGNLSTLNLEQIEASGSAILADAQVQLPETSAPLLESGDWITEFEWQGDRIAVNRFSAPGLQADGTIGIDFSRSLPIGAIALNVALQSYDLERLNGFIPNSISQYAQIDGFTSFNGQLTGTLNNPQLAGNAQLDNLAVNDLLFESLSGPIDFALADGGRVNLQGSEDRIQLIATDAPQREIPFWPVSFEVRNQDFLVRGTTEGDLLRAEVVELPLARLALRPAAQYGLGTVTGLLDANVNVNLADFSNPSASGKLMITQPSLAPVEAKQLRASFTYADGTATLQESELLFDESRYLLTGSANIVGEIAYQGELTIAEGRIEDLIPIAQALDFSALGMGTPDLVVTGSAADLATMPQGLPNDTFLARLESFREFLEEHPEAAAIAQRESEPEDRPLAETDLPPLDQLAGEFAGTVAFSGTSLAVADATADFNIQGDSWEWGENTPPNRFALRGEVAQSSVDIETAFVNAGETNIDLTASGNLNRLSGQLVVDDLPIALAQRIYPLPADVEGDLDLTTTFSGSLANPTIEGELAIADPQINNYLLSALDADFTYQNALLALNSTIAVSEQAQPISVEGTVPYALPLIEALPPTNLISLTAVVPNGNLEIINALSDERVQWQSGQGEVVVEVGGTRFEPAIAGKASFRNAAISSSLLEDDVTNLSGEVLFNLEQINVQQLQAQIDDGRLLIDGRLPLLPLGQSALALLTPGFSLGSLSAFPTDSTQSADALSVVLDNLPIDYDDLVSGVFGGQLLVTGTAFTPTVTGSLEISKGVVEATNVLQQASSLASDDDDEIEAINPYRADFLNIDPLELELAEPEGIVSELLQNVAIRDLQIRLEDRLTITARPVFRVTALGDLSVNGTLADLQPSGLIRLQTGEVNLFASQFRLDRGAPNTATFTPENGIDPFLDVELLARVQETDIDPLPPPAGGFANAEVNDSTVDTGGDVQFISVRAIAEGPASEITENLTLTSRPPREEGELLALLGGGTVTGLTTASLTQLGGFLGSGGALTTLGDRVADAVGLQSFRVFPTTDTSDDSSIGLGIGIEASAAIGDRFNISILEILNSTSPPQLGVLYRFTDELNIRGASNLDDTDFELEYRIEF